MKKVSVFIVFALLSVFIAGSVYAGVEPSPFRSKINQLNSVVNSLDSIDMRLERQLSDNQMPSPNGLVGLLNAMGNELLVLNRKVSKVLERLGTAPDDQHVYDALMGVKSVAAVIVERAREGFAVPSDDIRLNDALAQVRMNAQDIVDNINAFLGGPIPLPS
jgi:hypothetical protein